MLDRLQQVILGALQPQPWKDGRRPKNVYQGTVPYKVKQKRRAANRVAKASRKKNRR